LEKWATFATISGAAAAGLTGLLFVAVSIRIEVIARSAELRNRAAQALSLFVTVLFIAILLEIRDRQMERSAENWSSLPPSSELACWFWIDARAGADRQLR
jgi:hypothetical protein